MDKRVKHLEMIQAIILRMSNNSFYLKGLTVTIVSAIMALDNTSGSISCEVAYFPLLAFWVLDGYFLRQERLYRKLYDVVRVVQEDEITFSMNTGNYVKDISLISVIFSQTLNVFYLIILITIVFGTL